MRIVALEEHFVLPTLVTRIDREKIRNRGFLPIPAAPSGFGLMELAAEIGPERIRRMDEAKITVQVLSNTGPGPDLVQGPSGIDLAREMNDHLAEAIAKYPLRFAGFAVLPLNSPEACSEELQRCIKSLYFVGALVNGTTDGRFLDHPSYDDLLATAVELDVPIYVHPHLAPEPVRAAYYSGFKPATSFMLEGPGWGWHSETAIHVLRLVLAGKLDKHPKLKLIIGHMGEMIPMMLARADDVFSRVVNHLQRPISRTITDQVWVTTSGIFTEPPFMAALHTFGIDRLMFSVDYPYSSNAQGRTFLDQLELAPGDMAKLTHANADTLLKLGGG